MSRELIDRLERAREATLLAVRDLDDAALRAQPDPEFSPIAWHLGHVAFTEAQWIVERCGGDDSLTAPYAALWAQGATPKHERVRQPERAEIYGYLERVRARAIEVVRSLDVSERAERLARGGFVVWLVESHEHQHRETMAIVRRLALEAALAKAPPPPPRAREVRERWIAHAGGSCAIGTDALFAYDNEKPAHRIELAPFEIAAAPISVGDFDAFRADRGYAREDLWTIEGWKWRSDAAIEWPRGWTSDDRGRLAAVSGDALAPLDPDAPVSGLSCHEAEAYARWRDARLPKEAEWEACAPFAPSVWQWTSTWFAPYPGFEAFPYRGYSEPYFDGAHRVLRGGSVDTHPNIARVSFRNWYAPSVRQISAGARLAR
jgi:gamma-glutamyl hercynylcysteine S-oxide synthase